jgi:hypothetical protein
MALTTGATPTRSSNPVPFTALDLLGWARAQVRHVDGSSYRRCLPSSLQIPLHARRRQLAVERSRLAESAALAQPNHIPKHLLLLYEAS